MREENSQTPILDKLTEEVSRLRERETYYRALLHEIRTPLGTIKNYLFLVTEEMKKFGGGRRKTDVAGETLKAIADEVSRIEQIISSFAIDDRSEAGVSVLEEELVFMESVYKKLAQSRRIRFSVEAEDAAVFVPLSPHRIRHVISNLVTNALEASPEGGWVVLRGYRNGDTAVVEVEDSGGGVSEDLLPRLFREPIPSSKGEGHGIGLWVVDQIVKRSGGEIRYHRGKEGALFRVLLPIRERSGDEEDHRRHR